MATIEMVTTKGRNPSIELLRILAMFGIVVGHFYISAMGMYDDFRVDVSTPSGGALWSVLEVIKILSMPSVNCYILISGYFLINKYSVRTKGIWKVWSETWFYSVLLTGTVLLTGIEPVSGSEMLTAIFPFFRNEYWFITTYILLMFMAPFMSIMVGHLSKRQYQILLLVGFVICFQYPLGQYMYTEQQLLLFLYLYLIGGYIRLHVREMSPSRPAIAAVVVIAVMLAYCFGKNKVGGLDSFAIFAMSNNGLPLILSVCIFLFFRNIRIHGRVGQWINAIAPLSLAVYLIHSHPLLTQWLWDFVVAHVDTTPTAMLPLSCLGVSLVIFVACMLVDSVRHAIAPRVYSFFVKKR